MKQNSIFVFKKYFDLKSFLFQAKKFVEGVPVLVKSDLSKDEAEKLKEQLEKAGGECIIG